MPGISFIYSRNDDLREMNTIIMRSLAQLLHMQNYELKLIINERQFVLGSTAYKDYPIINYENDKYIICLEGHIYNKNYSLLEDELCNMADELFRSRNDSKEKYERWLRDADGEFVIIIYNKRTENIIIINDILGRLPLYYHNSNGRFLLSRELRYINCILNNNEFDRMAIAQYLLFGYTLGNKTLTAKTHRLKPASVIRIDAKQSSIDIQNYHELKFEYIHGDRSSEEYSDELVSLFTESCKIRSGLGSKDIISLSGGLDSRAVAACLYKIGRPFYGTTFVNSSERSKRDARYAEQLANALNINWKLIQLPPARGKDYLKLLIMKNGLNYLGMSFILSFFDSIKETYGSGITYLTGDGGDKLLKDNRAINDLKNIDDLVHYIISINHKFSLKDVSTLIGVKQHDIIEELRQHLIAYPEKDWNQKYVHFIICERGHKWLYEGEDRNRYYFWSIAPFYSTKLFNYAMNCPDDQKKGYIIYRNFLIRLSTEATNINYSNYKMPITSMFFNMRLNIDSIYLKLPPNVREYLRGIIRKKTMVNNNLRLVACLRDQLKNSPALNDYFTGQTIRKTITHCNRNQLETLITITSAIEEMKNGNSTLNKYHEQFFE